MVTQCPIAQNNSFLYSFTAQKQTGTYWYHSHYSTQTWFVDSFLSNLQYVIQTDLAMACVEPWLSTTLKIL